MGGETLEALNTGREVTKDKTQILNHIQNYYKDLYTSQRIDDEVIETYLQDTTCVKITSEHGNKCEEFITQEEITETIGILSLKKAPGRDGLSAEFYKKNSVESCRLC